MSIVRQLVNEFRPLFHMLEEPLVRTPMAYGFPRRSLLSDPFFTSPNALRPAVDVTEEGETYIVEADLPGVKKENVDISIGDGGRSVTIRGQTFSRSAAETAGKTSEKAEGEGAVVEATPNQLTSERLYSGISSFIRTVWLPRPVDSSKVSAKLADGILTLRVPKSEDKESVKITVE